MDTQATPNVRRKRLIDIDASLWAELLFIFLPFFVVFIVLTYKGGISGLIYIPEWSLAAAILSGQTIVKFISGLLSYGKRLNLGIVALIVTILIVIILAPSLVILSLILVSSSPHIWLAITQIILFVLSVSCFLFLGRVSQEILLTESASESR